VTRLFLKGGSKPIKKVLTNQENFNKEDQIIQ